jgi:hypothetical protein
VILILSLLIAAHRLGSPGTEGPVRWVCICGSRRPPSKADEMFTWQMGNVRLRHGALLSSAHQRTFSSSDSKIH